MVLTLSLKNLQRTEKCPFQMLKTFVFELKVASKSFSKKLLVTKLWFKQFWTPCLTFPENGFNFVTQKFAKKTEKCPFQTHIILVSSFRKCENHYPRSSLWPNFDLNNFERFASLSQKMVSTSSVKNFQKTEKCSFQTLRTFVFEFKVTSKPFSKKLHMIKFWFK